MQTLIHQHAASLITASSATRTIYKSPQIWNNEVEWFNLLQCNKSGYCGGGQGGTKAGSLPRAFPPYYQRGPGLAAADGTWLGHRVTHTPHALCIAHPDRPQRREWLEKCRHSQREHRADGSLRTETQEGPHIHCLNNFPGEPWRGRDNTPSSMSSWGPACRSHPPKGLLRGRDSNPAFLHRSLTPNGAWESPGGLRSTWNSPSTPARWIAAASLGWVLSIGNY